MFEARFFVKLPLKWSEELVFEQIFGSFACSFLTLTPLTFKKKISPISLAFATFFLVINSHKVVVFCTHFKDCHCPRFSFSVVIFGDFYDTSCWKANLLFAFRFLFNFVNSSLFYVGVKVIIVRSLGHSIFGSVILLCFFLSRVFVWGFTQP